MKFNRRDFLRTAATIAGGAAVGSIPILNSGCKQSTSPDNPEPPPSHDVSVKVTFYNHTQGSLGEKTYSGKSDESFAINIYGLGFGGVDSSRIAVRKAAARETMGSFLGFSRTGGVSIKFPETDDNWEAYLLNTGNNARYELIDYFIDLDMAKLLFPRNATWKRFDVNGATGPDEPILQVIDQFNGALNYAWKQYGSFTKSDPASVLVGYDFLNGPYNYLDHYVRVDPTKCVTLEDKLNYFTEGIFRVFTFVGPLGGDLVYKTVTDQPGHLSPSGRDLLTYIYVKDENF